MHKVSGTLSLEKLAWVTGTSPTAVVHMLCIETQQESLVSPHLPGGVHMHEVHTQLTAAHRPGK